METMNSVPNGMKVHWFHAQTFAVFAADTDTCLTRATESHDLLADETKHFKTTAQLDGFRCCWGSVISEQIGPDVLQQPKRVKKVVGAFDTESLLCVHGHLHLGPNGDGACNGAPLSSFGSFKKRGARRRPRTKRIEP